MLTPGDDFPLHQTAEVIAFSGTDRNFYDRYFFNGYSADGSVFFAAAFGIYPQLDIMDGAFNVIVSGKQYVLRVSKRMKGDRLDLKIGPMSVEIAVPLQVLRLKIAENDGPIQADLKFTGRHFPIQEPRFTRRIGTRSFMDYTRLTQNGGWRGEITVDGETFKLKAGSCSGTRDRSWGVRPVGTQDSQPPPEGNLSQYYWLWTPSNFKQFAVFMHTNDDEFGVPWNRRAVIWPDRAEAEEFDEISYDLTWREGTRRVDTINFDLKNEHSQAQLSFKTDYHFYMPGIGYFHPEWGHGMDRGDLDVAHEVYDFSEMDDNAPDWFHIQAMARAELSFNGKTYKGQGIVEQAFIGPHQPTD